MKNSSEENRSTDRSQKPRECEHYYESIAACELCGYHSPKCDNGYCPDYEPKKKKDNENK